MSGDRLGRRLIVALIGYAVLLRLVYGAQVELLPEEAYYWNYSRHLDFGYLDHPPLVAWLIRLGTMLFGATEFGVRSGALFCSGIASLFLFRLTRNLFGDACGLWSVALVQILPFFFMAGLLMTPDAPLAAAWAASLYFMERALATKRTSAWMCLGISLGIGLLAKYTIALLGLAMLSFLALDPDSRRWLRRWQPYAAALIAVAVFAPVIVWNMQHDWASFVFQTSRRLAERPQFSLHKLLGGALVLITPTGLFAVAAVFWSGRGDSPPRRALFLKVCVLVPLAIFSVFSVRHEVKLDWTGAPWVAAIPLLAFGAAGAYRHPALQRAWLTTFALLSMLYSVALYYLLCGLPGVGYSMHMELAPVGWRAFAGRIHELADQISRTNGAEILVIGMDRYAIASELAFYARDHDKSVAQCSAAHLFGDMGLMYEQWFPPAGQVGRTLLLVAWDVDNLSSAHLSGHVSVLDAVHEGQLTHNGRSLRRYYYRVAHGYLPGAQTSVDGSLQ